MLKKALLLIVFVFIVNILSAQEKKTSQLVKYVTTAPDGTTSITIFDDSRSNLMQLQAKHGFYKYELTDIVTKKKVYTAKNRGNRCVLNKLAFEEGTYDLRLYTKNFIISSRIKIAAIKENSIAMNE